MYYNLRAQTIRSFIPEIFRTNVKPACVRANLEDANVCVIKDQSPVRHTHTCIHTYTHAPQPNFPMGHMQLSINSPMRQGKEARRTLLQKKTVCDLGRNSPRV